MVVGILADISFAVGAGLIIISLIPSIQGYLVSINPLFNLSPIVGLLIIGSLYYAKSWVNKN